MSRPQRNQKLLILIACVSLIAALTYSRHDLINPGAASLMTGFNKRQLIGAPALAR